MAAQGGRVTVKEGEGAPRHVGLAKQPVSFAQVDWMASFGALQVAAMRARVRSGCCLLQYGVPASEFGVVVFLGAAAHMLSLMSLRWWPASAGQSGAEARSARADSTYVPHAEVSLAAVSRRMTGVSDHSATLWAGRKAPGSRASTGTWSFLRYEVGPGLEQGGRTHEPPPHL